VEQLIDLSTESFPIQFVRVPGHQPSSTQAWTVAES